MDGTPNDECPVCAVPKSAQEHDHSKVQVGAARSFLVAAERDVEVVAEPGGKRNVPAAPKVCDAFGEIGAGEVFRNFEAEHATEPDSHVGVAAEVEIDLEGVGGDAKPGVDSVRRFGVEDGVGDCAHGVREQDLFGKSEDENGDTAGKALERVRALGDLFGEDVVADDGSSHEVGKEAHKTGQIGEGAGGADD